MLNRYRAGFPDRRPHRAAAARLAAVGMLTALAAAAACSTDGVMAMRPEVDVGQTAAVPAVSEPIAAAAATPALSEQRAAEPAQSGEPAVDEAGSAMPGGSLAPVEPAVETAAVVGPMSLPQTAPGDADMTDETTLAPPERPLAAPEEKRIVEPETVLRPAPKTVAYPRFVPPVLAPSRDALSADDIACRRELKRIGVVYRELPPIDEGGSCHVDNPVLVSALSGGIRMQPAATLNCEMALTFARWTKNELAPAARYRYLSGVKAIHQGSSYSCRNINGTHTSSEHSRGNALDVMRIELNNGRDIDVRKPGWFAFRQRGFLNTVRADGCSYFTTVLGPGYNYDHRNHFHFDIKPRRNGYRACR